MNYRHIYHAGSFADVMKHFVLTLLLQKLRQKETPYSIIDTHAGIGLYDLTSEAAQKTLEYKEGIERLLHINNIDPLFEPYIKAVLSVNASFESGKLSNYPGSPCISRYFLRDKDRLFLSELHPEDYKTLRNYFKRDDRVKVFHQDFLVSLKAFLPPLHRRGLVLIDPPFEKTNEFDQMLEGLKEAHKRFSYGIFALWFPIKDSRLIKKFYQKLTLLGLPKTLAIDFLIQKPTNIDHLNGCGMVIINPPWQIEETLKNALPKLLRYLGHSQGHSQIQWLVKET
jgi:23S rRNA (adenine2030-N6)-methyltransferase